MTILDWILRRDKDQARQAAEAKAKMTRQAQQELAQEHVQIQPRQARPKPAPEPERPAVRLMPHEAVRMKEAHERQPEAKPEPEPEPTQEATRMKYTRTRQPGPTMGGPGVPFVNPLAHSPKKSFADDLLAEARTELAKKEAAMTPEQKLERDKLAQELDQSLDDSQGRKL